MENENTIQTVKKQVDENNELVGWLVNGVVHVPGNAPGNRHYQMVQEYIANGGVVEPAYTKEELQITSINKQIAEAKAYLTETGWYIERLNDPSSSKAIPEEVLTKRAEAREVINTLEAELAIIEELMANSNNKIW